MGKTRSIGLMQSVARKGVRRRGLRGILRSLLVAAERQEGVTVARVEAEMALNPIFRRAWERGGRG